MKIRCFRARSTAALCLCLTAVAHAQPTTRVLVQTSDPAPDGDGLLNVEQAAVLNDTGMAAYQADLFGTSNNIGIYRTEMLAGGTSTVRIAREGQAAPNNGVFSSFRERPALNDAGQSAFWASLSGTAGGGSDNSGLFIGDGATLIQVVREGDAAPGGNGAFNFNFEDPAINNMGQVAWLSALTGTSGGSADDAGIYRGDGTTLVQIAREGQAAPDNNGVFSTLKPAALNNLGQVAFAASLTGTSGGFQDNTGIFRGDGTTLTRIAREGQAAPDGDGKLAFFSDPALNDSGQAAFEASVNFLSPGSDAGGGIFLGDGATLTQIVREGESAPGGNGRFSNLSDPALNNDGQIAFLSFLDDTAGVTSDDEGIFLHDGSTLTEVARAGMAAPDGNGVLSALSDPAINEDGQVAFSASLTGTSGGLSDNSAIYFYDPDRGLMQVIREGDPFLGSSIERLDFFDGVAGFGDERSGLGDGGRVAFHFETTGNTEGIAVWSLPEPTIPGDFDLDGDVDAFDLGIWQSGFGTGTGADTTDGDADGDGDVDAFDLGIWQANFGTGVNGAAVPEPATLGLLATLALGVTRRRRGS